MKKKLFRTSILLMLLLSLVIFSVACTKNNDTSDDKPKEETTASTDETKTSEESKEEATNGEKEVIKISTTGNHAFFSETNEKTGELQGYEIDVWNEIEKEIIGKLNGR